MSSSNSNNGGWYSRNTPSNRNNIGAASREAQVLERQRQMADRLAGIRSTTSSTTATASVAPATKVDVKGNAKPKPPPPPPPSCKIGGNQRSLASLLGGGGGGKSKSIQSSKPTSMTNSTHATSSTQSNQNSNFISEAEDQQRRILQEQARRKELDRLFGNRRETTQRSQQNQQQQQQQQQHQMSSATKKRPSLKRPRANSNAANSAEMALAKARQRVQGVSDDSLKQSSNNTMAGENEGYANGRSSASGAGMTHDPSNACSASKLKRAPLRRNRIGVPSAGATNASTGASGGSATGGSGASSVGGSLSSLLLSNSSTAKYLQPNAPKLLKHYNKIEPNDYWRNLRRWDFLGELNGKMLDQKSRNGGGGGRVGGGRNGRNGKRKRGSDAHDGDEQPSQPAQSAQPAHSVQSAQPAHAPLPNTFQSYRQYCALWSPLLLQEARAQLLSEAITEIPYWRSKPEKHPVKVLLQPLKKDIEGTGDCIGVVVKKVFGDFNGGNGGRGGSNRNDRSSFMANDFVLLAKEESFIWAATKGNLKGNDSHNQTNDPDHDGISQKAMTNLAIIGHVEHTRRSLEGLLIQVSRELWTQLGTQEVTLLKIGSNVTALREYTALCRMDRIPLLDYILGSKMSTTSKKSKKLIDEKGPEKNGDENDGEQKDPTAKEERAKRQILANIGGSTALGKGFSEYARNKFNLSQLGAIASSAMEYGDGGFTLIKGPPGTGKTTTLCALLNALHIKQMNQYFAKVKSLSESLDAVVGKRAALSLAEAAKQRPRILVAAPSNAAVDNVILKIMEEGFVDGNGCRYNPSIVRVGVGQSASVKDVCLEEKVEGYVSDAMDVAKLEQTIEGYKAECRRIHTDIAKLRKRMNAIKNAAPYPLSKNWEIRVDEDNFEFGPPNGGVYFVNHKEKKTTYEVPPPPEPGEKHFPARAMPEYKAFISRVVKLVERYNGISSKIERYCLCQNAASVSSGGSNNSQAMVGIRMQLETHILDSVHIVMTTLGTAGNRALEAANKFEVIVVDEAAQSVEPSTLAGLQLGSSHAILVGDPQQLPATIFSVSGRNTKYDRSLFQRLEEAGHEVHMLNTQYRMHPMISDFPRRIFYDGKLMDGPNVKHPEYGNPLKRAVFKKFPSFQSFTVLDLESSEERGGTSLANSAEAQLALHLYNNLQTGTEGLSTKSRVAVITPYSQQAALLRRTFSDSLGGGYERFVEVNTVDAFQGREANIVIFSCVRAAGSRGIGFLSDVRRMNVALTRAKFFLFVIARCSSIVVNPYWRDLVDHALESEAVIKVPFSGNRKTSFSFPDLSTLESLPPPPKEIIPVNRKGEKSLDDGDASSEEGEIM